MKKCCGGRLEGCHSKGRDDRTREVSSDSVLIHRFPSNNPDEFTELIWDEKHVLDTFYVGAENNSELLSLF